MGLLVTTAKSPEAESLKKLLSWQPWRDKTSKILWLQGYKEGSLHIILCQTAVDGVDRVETWSSSYHGDQPLILVSNWQHLPISNNEAEGVSGSSESSDRHYFASGSCDSRRGLSRLGDLLRLLLISLHNLFCATGDRFKSCVSWFLLLGLPIVSSALLSVVFAWISVLSFSSLVPLLGVFHLFIYLFIMVVLQICVGTQLY
jgi:hypothetical protein